MLNAPFPFFGGKSRAAPLIWERLGNVPNYCEAFAGSLAVLLHRPHAPGIETVNDKDGFISCVWRALAADPAQVAHYAAWPANEACLHARHLWLRARRDELTARLMADPDYYDAQIAGFWLWGISLWIGGGWCGPSGAGPWVVQDGMLVDSRVTGADQSGAGVRRKLVHLARGRGVHRQLLHLGDAGRGVTRQRLHLGAAVGNGAHGKQARGEKLLAWFEALQQRLRHVRVCCGDWTRVMGPSVLEHHGVTGVLLDPPYQQEERDGEVYAVDTAHLAEEVRHWALAHGDNPLLRIALCGYATATYTMPDSWEQVTWKANGGMGNQSHGRGRVNASRETLWFSPHCLKPQQGQIPFGF